MSKSLAATFAATFGLALIVMAIACTATSTPGPNPNSPKIGAGSQYVGAQSAVSIIGDANAPQTLYGSFGQVRTISVEIATGTLDGSATFSGTLAFQGSNDGVNWSAINCINMGAAPTTVNAVVTQSATANGLWQCAVGGFGYFQAQGQSVAANNVLVVYNLATDSTPISVTAILDGGVYGTFRGTY